MNKEQQIEEMIKIMEECQTDNCEDCKYYNSHIDILRVNAQALRDAGYRKVDEALKDFAKKLKEKYGNSCSENYPLLIECTSEDIDELLKELL